MDAMRAMGDVKVVVRAHLLPNSTSSLDAARPPHRPNDPPIMSLKTLRPFPPLALELKAEILSHCDASTLAKMSSASLAFLELASPLLYRHITFVGPHGLDKFLKHRVSASSRPIASYPYFQSFKGAQACVAVRRAHVWLSFCPLPGRRPGASARPVSGPLAHTFGHLCRSQRRPFPSPQIRRGRG